MRVNQFYFQHLTSHQSPDENNAVADAGILLQYKDLIREQDQRINEISQANLYLQQELANARQQAEELASSVQALQDQNALLRRVHKYFSLNLVDFFRMFQGFYFWPVNNNLQKLCKEAGKQNEWPSPLRCKTYFLFWNLKKFHLNVKIYFFGLIKNRFCNQIVSSWYEHFDKRYYVDIHFLKTLHKQHTHYQTTPDSCLLEVELVN